jgi:hypothetical protein
VDARRNQGAEYVDTDGIGEIVDTFRGMGLTEASDQYCCEGTLFLLRVQLKDGSFPVTFADGEKPTSAYDLLHSTWVCTQCLRDRDFQISRNMKWLGHAERLLKLTDFGHLDYEASWLKGSKKAAAMGIDPEDLSGES